MNHFLILNYGDLHLFIKINKKRMSYGDFMRNWESVQMCHLTIDSFSTELYDNVLIINFVILYCNKVNLNFHLFKDDHLMWKCRTYQSKW